MSTTFGIRIPTTGEVVEVARRYAQKKGCPFIDLYNPLVHLLPRDTPVIAIDNTAQGINTVGDLIDAWTENGG